MSVVNCVSYSVLGGKDDMTDRDEIWAWTGEDWVEVGRMKMARRSHAISSIRMDDEAMGYCV